MSKNIVESPYQVLLQETEKLKIEFFSKSMSKYELIAFCVDVTTIRSFRHDKGIVKKYKPLSIFRAWATSYIDNLKTWQSKSYNDFAQVRKEAYQSLKKFWQAEDGGTPDFHHFNKLIDLFFKFLPWWDEIRKKDKEFIFRYAHVPLDKFSLDFLRRCNPALRISKNVSMSYVKNLEDYNKYQNEIRNICCDIEPMIFDLYAWKISHQPHSKPFILIPLDKHK